MKILITRSFSQKKQVKEYEPVEFFCSATTEVEDEELIKEGILPEAAMKNASATLDKFVQLEVEKSLNDYLAARLPKSEPKTRQKDLKELNFEPRDEVNE